MPSTDHVVVGRVGRPHGLDGAFFVEGPSDDARWFKTGARLWVDGEELEVITARRGAGGRPVIKLEREVARGAELEVPVDALPPTEEGEYYAFQLVGLEVIEDGGQTLGHVLSVEPGVANDALALDSGLLLPLIEPCVHHIDLAAGRILVRPGFSDPA